MGMLIDGTWTPERIKSVDGRFHRRPSTFRNWIEPNGTHPPAAARYHLYVSLACPWASRTLLARTFKGLERVIGVTTLDPDVRENGWAFESEGDPISGWRYLYEVYRESDPHYSGNATVPVLWDCEREVIVNNESADIVRIFNSAFSEWAPGTIDLYPADLSAEIDELNDLIYSGLNNGVYGAGFATTQAAYQEAVQNVFATLAQLESRLSIRRFLFGARLTETDLRLFTTAIRFDTVYYSHFKCNAARFQDFVNLHSWLLDVYQLPGVAQTVNLEQIKRHYFGSHRWINPSGIVPVGPTIDWNAPPRRTHLGAPR